MRSSRRRRSWPLRRSTTIASAAARPSPFVLAPLDDDLHRGAALEELAEDRHHRLAVAGDDQHGGLVPVLAGRAGQADPVRHGRLVGAQVPITPRADSHHTERLSLEGDTPIIGKGASDSKRLSRILLRPRRPRAGPGPRAARIESRMVRPERGRVWTARSRCCIRLAGVSPAAVSAGAPRSRLRARARDRGV